MKKIGKKIKRTINFLFYFLEKFMKKRVVGT